MRGETFDETRERMMAQDAIGQAIAEARWERGQRTLTEDEQTALNRWSMWGSDAYPVRKCGRGWTWEMLSLTAPTIYKTKREAVRAWEIQIAIFIAISGMQSRERALAS